MDPGSAVKLLRRDHPRRAHRPILGLPNEGMHDSFRAAASRLCIRSEGTVSNKPYQHRVEEWLTACFPPHVRVDQQERNHRFLEEALELAQANGCSKDDALALVNYVYGRPAGQPDLEVGGVMVTLASLCSATAIDMNEAGDRELARNWDRIDSIRQKQASKPHGSPLPQ